MTRWLASALWMALEASVVFIRLAIFVALTEIMFGIIGETYCTLR